MATTVRLYYDNTLSDSHDFGNSPSSQNWKEFTISEKIGYKTGYKWKLEKAIAKYNWGDPYGRTVTYTPGESNPDAGALDSGWGDDGGRVSDEYLNDASHVWTAGDKVELVAFDHEEWNYYFITDTATEEAKVIVYLGTFLYGYYFTGGTVPDADDVAYRTATANYLVNTGWSGETTYQPSDLVHDDLTVTYSKTTRNVQKTYTYTGAGVDMTDDTESYNTDIHDPSTDPDDQYTYSWTSSPTDTSYSSTGDKTITWTRTRTFRNFTIQYDKNHTDLGGDDAPEDQTITYGTQWAVAEDISRPGYSFAGWWTESTGDPPGEQRGTNNDQYEDDTLFARWDLAETSITFNKRERDDGSGSYLESGSLPTTNANSFGDDDALPRNELVLNYYTGDGWNTNSGVDHTDLTAAAWTFSISSTTVNLYGKFRANELTVSYKTRFSSIGETGTDKNNEKFYYSPSNSLDISSKQPDPIWVFDNYTFDGWSRSHYVPDTDLDWDLIETGDTSINVYACWKFTVSYDSNGGTGGPGDHEEHYGRPWAASDTEPARDFYNFDGWWKKDASNNFEIKIPTDTATDDIYGNITLYARWKFTVSYNLNGGTDGPSDHEEYYGIPWDASDTEPTQDFCNFDGWWKKDASDNFDSTITTNNDIYGNITLYARWKCDIKYHSNDFTGAQISPESIADGTFYTDDSVNFSVNFFSQEKKFQIGWRVDYDNSSFSDEIVLISITSFSPRPSHVNVYAIWESNKYTITYKQSNNSSDFYNKFYVPSFQEYIIEDLILDASLNNTLKLKKIYIEYKGFYTDGWTQYYGSDVPVLNPDDFWVDPNTKDKPKYNITLYPIWKIIDYKLIKNDYNYLTIYSQKTPNKVFFYPYIKRWKHSINFTSIFSPSIDVKDNKGVILNDSYSLNYILEDDSELSINSAYDFFFYGETLPDIKSLSTLQNTYQKNSLIELRDVTVVKHYSSKDSIIATDIYYNDINSVDISGTNDYYYQFENNGTFETDVDVMCEILLVGCGGNGGNGSSGGGGGGGGGGGEVVHVPLYVLEKGLYAISVGKDFKNNIIQISQSFNHTLILIDNGEVFGYGDNNWEAMAITEKKTFLIT
jgi:hypothetical protein